MRKISLGILSLGLAGFLLGGRVWAVESDGLDRVLGVSMNEGKLVVVDGGGSDWSNNGSEVLLFDEQGVVEWRYKGELVFAHSARRLVNGNWLITNTGLDKLVEVNKEGERVWSSSQWEEGELLDGSSLDYPNDAEEVGRGVYLVVDRNNDRVIKINKAGEILWEYDKLYRPHNADQLESGDILVSDSERNRVIEINEEKEVVWEYKGELNWPRDVDEMKSGNRLIVDSRNHRVLEVSKEGEIVWEFKEGLYWPYEADELENGNILIADSQNRRVIEVNKEKEVVKEWGYDLKRDLRSSLVNGGFEKLGQFEAEVKREVEYEGEKVDVNRLVEGEVAEGWRPGVVIGEDKGKLSIDEEVAKEGEKSGRIDYRGEGHVFWLQQFKAPQEGRWRLSGWVKTDSQERPGRGARLEIWIEGEKGGFVAEPVVSEWVKGDKDWKKVRAEVEIPEEGEVVQVRALFNDTGTAWFDELRWERVGWWKRWGKWFVLGMGAVGLVRIVVGRVKDE